MLFHRMIVPVCGALAVAGSLGAGNVFGADFKVLPGHVPAVVGQLNPLGALPSTNQLRLAIGVSLRDSAGLDRFLTQLYDPASTNYHKYLTPDEFTARFGPTEQDYQSVVDFARANGLTVLETESNRLVLDVSGSASSVETALHIRFNSYQHPTESRHFFAPDTEPSVDASLPVADIQGLSDFSKPHPHFVKASATAAPRDGSAEYGSYMGDDFRNAYAAGTTMTGAGQMVGLLQFDGYYAGDIANYAQAAGGNRPNITVQTVLLDGYSGTPTQDGGSTEVSLDIEMAMAMAPGLSKIMVFEAGPNGNPNDILNSMVQNSAVKSFSSSWGWSGGPSTTMDNIFKEMATQGQSFFNASGDDCAFTVGANSVNGVDNPNNENTPSSSPYITVVGGTSLYTDGSSYSSETVWNYGGGEGSSGGVSSAYTIPSWQTAVNPAANGGSSAQRNIPDVALTADNVFAYYGNGQSSLFGGTSCAAPLWAGFMALVNQQAVSEGNATAGFINPAIYAIGAGQNASNSYSACFNDVTSGNNFSPQSPNNYSAGTGYDLCTGLGTPNGTGLIPALAGGISSGGTTNTNTGSTNNTTSGPAELSISPNAGFSASGYFGGPFAPNTFALQVTNASSTAGSWSLVSTSAWFKVLSTGGTVQGNSAVNITAEFASPANSLKPGAYATSIIFSNLPAGTVEAIPVTLQVNQPLTVSTTQGFNAVGTAGSTFTPSSEAIILTNLGGTTLSWSLVNTSTWLSVSTKSGSIAKGSHVTITASLATTDKSLKAGNYTANVSISDSAGVVAVLPFSLTAIAPVIQNGGFETGTFSGWTLSGKTSGVSVQRSNSSYVENGTYGASLGNTGTPGYLSQTLATAPGQNYLLSLWLRNATGRTPNWFEVQWNGNTLYYQTNFVNKNWTNLLFSVNAPTSATPLEFTFQGGSLEALGLDNITVTPVVTANARFVVQNSSDFHLTWNVTPGATYQPQYSSDLAQPNWTNFGDPVQAGGDTLDITDTNALQLAPQRFYRLLVVPTP